MKSHVKGYCELIRFADDFVCLVQHEQEARKIERALHNRLNKYGLQPDKSKVISFGRGERQEAEREGRKASTFTFLGFMHFCDRTRKGGYKVGRTTDAKKFRAKCKELNDWLRRHRNAMDTTVDNA